MIHRPRGGQSYDSSRRPAQITEGQTRLKSVARIVSRYRVSSDWIHAHRNPGRAFDPLHPDRPVIAGGPKGSRSGQPGELFEQLEATRARLPRLRQHGQSLARIGDHLLGQGWLALANQDVVGDQRRDPVLSRRGRFRTPSGTIATDYAAAITGGFNGEPHSDYRTPYRRIQYFGLIVRNGTAGYPVSIQQPTSLGLSNTMLLGHTWQNSAHYNTSEGYHGAWTDGFGITTVRSTAFPPRPDPEFGDGFDYSFGGPHQGVVAAMGDGSVRVVSFAIDLKLWNASAHR